MLVVDIRGLAGKGKQFIEGDYGLPKVVATFSAVAVSIQLGHRYIDTFMHNSFLFQQLPFLRAIGQSILLFLGEGFRRDGGWW